MAAGRPGTQPDGEAVAGMDVRDIDVELMHDPHLKHD
jgi:hypothetical protein